MTLIMPSVIELLKIIGKEVHFVTDLHRRKCSVKYKCLKCQRSGNLHFNSLPAVNNNNNNVEANFYLSIILLQIHRSSLSVEFKI